MQVEQQQDALLSLIKKLPDHCIIQCVKEFQIYKNESLFVTKWFVPLSCLSTDQFEVFKELENYASLIEENLDESSKYNLTTFMNELSPRYSQDEFMQKLTKLKKLEFFDDHTCVIKEEAQIEFNDGIVYLLYFWDQREDEFPYGKVMELCQQVFERNPQWKGKARLIGLHIDQTIDSLKQQMKSKLQKEFEHYQLESADGLLEKLLKQQRRNSFMMLINKWGRIIDIWDYSIGKFLDEYINEQIAAEIDRPSQDKKSDSIGFNSVTEAEYKELKMYMKKCSVAINEVGYKGYISLYMQKMSYLKSSGTKVFHCCTQLRLNYNVDVKYRSQIKAFLENEWKQIPEHMKEIKDQIIDDPEGSYKQFREAFSSVGAEIYYEYIDITYLDLDEAKSSFEVVTSAQDKLLMAKNLNFQKYFSAQAYLKEQTNITHYNFQDYLDQLKKNNELNSDKGQKFVSMYYKKWKEEEYTEIEHVPGQVLVVFFWTTSWKIEDIKALAELLEKNKEKWGKSVRIIVACLDPYQEEIMVDNEQYAQYLDFYFPDESMCATIINFIHLNNNRYIVVDKFGIIRISPERDIDYSMIDNLLIEKELQQLEKEKGDFTEETVQNLINFTQQTEIKEKLSQIERSSFLEFRIKLEQHRIEDKMIFFKIPILNVTCRDFQLQEVNWILENLFSIIPEDQWKINKQIQKTISVEYPGAVCAVCQKDILQQTQQYYSPFKKEHVCVECAEFEDQTKKGSERFKYLDTLIFVNGPLTDLSVLTNIEQEKIGKNLQLKQGEEGSQCHNEMRCNGCGSENSQGARFIAANARINFIDYCQACFFVLKDKQSEQAQQLIAKDENYGMTGDNLLIKILFNHGGYNDF